MRTVLVLLPGLLLAGCGAAQFGGRAAADRRQPAPPAPAAQTQDATVEPAAAPPAPPAAAPAKPAAAAVPPAPAPVKPADAVAAPAPAPAPPVDTCPTAVDANLAHFLTEQNLATMQDVLTAEVASEEDGPSDFFQTVDTQPKLAAWAAKALALPDGSDFPFTDGWCHPLGDVTADAAHFTLTFGSAGPDGVFGNADDLIVTWNATDY